MTENMKCTVLTVIGGLVGAILGAGSTCAVGINQQEALVEATEKATVERLSRIYDNVTEDMDYEEAFSIIFADSEKTKREKNELSKELEKARSDLNTELKSVKHELEEKQKIIDEYLSDTDQRIEEQAKEYAASGDYLKALVELRGIIKTNQRTDLLVKEYTQKYEANVASQANIMMSVGAVDMAAAIIDEGLVYVPDSKSLKDLKQKVSDSQPKNMIDVVPSYQHGGSNYKEYSIRMSGGVESFYMGGKKYFDGITFRTYYTTWAVYNLDKKYNELKFTLCHVDGSDNGSNTKLQVFYNGSLSEEYELSPDMDSQDITLNVTNVKQLKLQVLESRGTNVYYGLGNPIIN